MKNSLTHSTPSYFSLVCVRTFLLIGLFAASLAASMAQSSSPAQAIKPVHRIEVEDLGSVYFEVDYEKAPSQPMTKNDITTYLVDSKQLDSNLEKTTPEVLTADARAMESLDIAAGDKAEAVFEVEKAAAPFEIGKKVAFEGVRVANIDPDGLVILMEDMIRPILYVRFQKFNGGNIEVKMYNEHGVLMTAQKTSNMMFGAEIQLDYSTWSEGTHTMQIRLDNGTKLTKKIVKTAATVSNF